MLEILAKRSPFDRIFDVALALGFLDLHLGVPGPHRGPLAHHFERDPLPDIALPAPVGDQAFVRPAEHVDETRRDGQTAGVDRLPGRTRAVPDAGDPVAL